jgi:hypothetical protein
MLGGTGAIGGVCVHYIPIMTEGGILGLLTTLVTCKGLVCLCEAASIHNVYRMPK